MTSQTKIHGRGRGRAAARFPVRHANTIYFYGQWAYEDRLIDLSDVIGPFASLFDPDALGYATLFDATTGRRGLYALPMGFATNHVHVWRSLLEQAGFTLDDIPKQWEAFWSFWCDQVQPAVRKATRPRRHLRRRPGHVGRGDRHKRTSSSSSCRPTRPTT